MVRPIERDERTGDPTSDVLRNAPAKVVVKRGLAAGEYGTVVFGAERLERDLRRVCHSAVELIVPPQRSREVGAWLGRVRERNQEGIPVAP